MGKRRDGGRRDGEWARLQKGEIENVEMGKRRDGEWARLQKGEIENVEMGKRRDGECPGGERAR